MADDASRERSRIEQVYATYEEDGSARRWDASQPGNAAILAEREDHVARLLRPVPVKGRVLEIGCGNGQVLAALPVASELRTGVDLLDGRLRQAVVDQPAIRVLQADATDLPFPTASFSLAVAFTVFSSVPAATTRRMLAGELTRVVQPGGHLLWYDLRVPNPGNRRLRPIRAAELGRLFDGWTIDVNSVTLLPPLARRLGSSTHRWYAPLARVPVLRSHLVGVLTRG